MRGKLTLVIGILMVLSGMSIIPMLGNADETDADNQSGSDQLDWTIPLTPANMVDDPAVDDATEEIIINEDTGGNRIYLGDEGVDLSFTLTNDGDDTTDWLWLTATDLWVNMSSNHAKFEVDGTDIGEQWGPLAIPASVIPGSPFSQTIDFTINVTSTDDIVERVFNNMFTCTIEYTDGTDVYSASIDISLYISSIVNPDNSDEPFMGVMTPMGGGEFLPHDEFVEAEIAIMNNATFAMIDDVVATVTVPSDFSIYQSGYAMVPTGIAAAASEVFNYRVDVAGGTLPGTYSETFDLTYLRQDTAVEKTIIEHDIGYEVDVAFAPFVEASAPSMSIAQDDLSATFDITFDNNGNVDLYDVKVMIDTSAGDLKSDVGFAYTQGTGAGSATLTDVYTVGDLLIGGTDSTIFNVIVTDGIEAGTHYVPLKVSGFYYNDGSLGDATAYVEFNLSWEDNGAAGDLNPPLDPVVDLDPVIDIPAAGTAYPFGAITMFTTSHESNWTTEVTDDTKLFIGGNSDTNVNIPVNVTLNTYTFYGFDNINVTLYGGVDTPFAPVNDSVLLTETWFTKDKEALWFNMDITATAADIEMRNGSWDVPISIMADDIENGTTLTFMDVLTIDFVDVMFEVSSNASMLEVEEQTLAVVGDNFTINNNLGVTLEDAEVTMYIGPNTPFVDAENHSVTSLTTYVGDLADGDGVIFDLDMNPMITAGTYPVDFTVMGYTNLNMQYIEMDFSYIQRVIPEPVDISVSGITFVDDIIPGRSFTTEINITNMGGQMAHNLVVDIDPAEALDDDFTTLEDFLTVIQVEYMDTATDNKYDTTNWASQNGGVLDMDNVSLENVPGQWFLPLNESLPLFGIESGQDVYELADWTRGAFSSPVPQVYTLHIDTLGAGDTFILTMEWFADKEMIPGRVYTDVDVGNELEVQVSWFDELNVQDWYNTSISMKTENAGTPYQEAASASGAEGDIGDGMLALIVVLLIIIIVLMLLGWSEIRRPYEEEEYDMMEEDFGTDEPVINEPMPEPFEEPKDQF